MSRRRNRHHSAFIRSDPLLPKDFLQLPTATSRLLHVSAVPREPPSLHDRRLEKVYNRNLSLFRDNFNQNDTSQLPFMSSLRQHEVIEKRSLTVSLPFEASSKTTMNQLIRKRISDFAAKTTRMSTASYRWHGKSGLNNKSSTEYECSLRDYNDGEIGDGFYSYVKPIHYTNVEEKTYNPEELICSRQRKFFKVK